MKVRFLWVSEFDDLGLFIKAKALEGCIRLFYKEGREWPHFFLLLFLRVIVVLNDFERVFILVFWIELDFKGSSRMDLPLAFVDIPVGVLAN